MKPFWLLPIVLLCACAPTTTPTPALATPKATIPSATPAPATATATASAVPTAVAPSRTPVPRTVTAEPTRPPAALTIAFVTDTPALANTETPTPAITPTLSTRNPTLPELGAYFAKVYPDRDILFDWAGITATTETLNGGLPVLISRDLENNAANAALTYTDVNGDGLADLVSYGEQGLIVLLWQGDHYSQPFSILQDPGTWLPPDNTASFADWTGDGKPEIVYDSKNVSVHGAGGILGTDTTRYLVHCQADACLTIWQGDVAEEIADAGDGGMLRYQVDMRSTITRTGTLAIRTVGRGFYLYCCQWYGDDSLPNFSSLHILTSTLSIYPWTGQAFGPAQEQVISGAQRIASRSELAATNAQGVVAIISAHNNYAPDGNNDVCQLSVAGQSVGGLFGCRSNFTTVEWKDITSDGMPDIIIITYSNAHPRDQDENELSNDDCIHQRLLAYQWDGQHATPIANVAGCVIREDLYGVRLADVDGDGKLEIEAAPNGALQNRAYKWNGKQFVLWSNVPLLPEP